MVKIDRVFLEGISSPDSPDPADTAVIEAAVLLARTNGMQVVAEGIETEAQFRLVRSLGCDLAQGFLFGRPGIPEHVTLSRRSAEAA